MARTATVTPAEPARPAESGYIPALDGLRAVAILLVVVSHAGFEHWVPGAFGVTLFFFISGYLITRQLVGGLSRHEVTLAGPGVTSAGPGVTSAGPGRIDLGGFYLRRVLRLAPAGLVYTAVAGCVFIWAGGRVTAAGWLSAAFYGANIYDLWVGYVSTLPGVRHPFNILWSLAIEEHFYLIWPLVLGAAWRWRGAVAGLILLCLAVLAWRLVLFQGCELADWRPACGRVQANPLWHYNRLYLGTDTRFDSIAWGALLAMAEHRGQAWVRFAGRSIPLQAACLLLLATGFVLPGAFARHVLRSSLQGAAMLVLFPAVLHQDHALRRLLCTRAALIIGRLSYSLYLWHWGAFAVADRVAGANRPLWLAIGLPLSTVAACASYALVERPMLRLRRHFGSHAPLRVSGEGVHATV